MLPQPELVLWPIVRKSRTLYYSATVGDREMYYDKTGKSVDMNSMRNPKMK